MKENDTTEVIELLKSYAVYQQQLFAERYASTFFCSSHDELTEEECQEKMDYIKNLIAGLAPSHEATLLNLHYIKGLSLEKCAECMMMSRSSAYRILNRAHIAFYNRYQRMKGANNERN